jgi:hypothetical protein
MNRWGSGSLAALALLGGCAWDDGGTIRRTVEVQNVGRVDVWGLESPEGVYDLQVYGPMLERFNLAVQRQAVESAVASFMREENCGQSDNREPPRLNVKIYAVTAVCRPAMQPARAAAPASEPVVPTIIAPGRF